MEQYVAEL